MRSHFLSRVFYCAELVRGLVGQTICLPGLTIWPSRRKGVEVQCSASHQETLVSNLRMFFSGGQYMYNVYCTGQEGQLIKRVHICIVGTTPAHLRWHTVPFYTQYHSDSDCTVYSHCHCVTVYTVHWWTGPCHTVAAAPLVSQYHLKHTANKVSPIHCTSVLFIAIFHTQFSWLFALRATFNPFVFAPIRADTGAPQVLQWPQSYNGIHNRVLGLA